MPALGAYIGWNHEFIATWLEEKMRHTHTPFFEANDTKSPQTKARLVGCRAPQSGAWLTTPLTDPLLRLNSTHFSLAIRLRLGLPPQDDLPAECACGEMLESNPDHFIVAVS